MSKTAALSLSVIGFCVLLSGTAFATQPPDVVSSDGAGDTAMGTNALESFNGGAYDTAAGASALQSNTSGLANSAFGWESLLNNTTGNYNAALGMWALAENSTGAYNAACGALAMSGNDTGSNNTAVGYQSLAGNDVGSNDIAIGYQAAYNMVNGYNNIDIGYDPTSAMSESNTIRIGQPGTQTATYITGISGTQVTGAAVYVTSTGQLGVLASSERYKTNIKAMADDSDKLERLRPVTFNLKTDPKREMQYGLIAEEVDKVLPELVIHNGEGRIEGVRYEELAPMLLNEVQRQQKQIAELQQQVAKLAKRGSLVGRKGEHAASSSTEGSEGRN
jgi:trimeric autotransporter adhesin